MRKFEENCTSSTPAGVLGGGVDIFHMALKLSPVDNVDCNTVTLEGKKNILWDEDDKSLGSKQIRWEGEGFLANGTKKHTQLIPERSRQKDTLYKQTQMWTLYKGQFQCRPQPSLSGDVYQFKTTKSFTFVRTKRHLMYT